MRVTILFFLTACILGLTIWGIYTIPALMETFPNEHKKEQMGHIEELHDVVELKSYAMELVYGHDAIALERDHAVGKMSMLLAIILFMATIAQIILFREIAARGRQRIRLEQKNKDV